MAEPLEPGPDQADGAAEQPPDAPTFSGVDPRRRSFRLGPGEGLEIAFSIPTVSSWERIAKRQGRLLRRTSRAYGFACLAFVLLWVANMIGFGQNVLHSMVILGWSDRPLDLDPITTLWLVLVQCVLIVVSIGMLTSGLWTMRQPAHQNEPEEGDGERTAEPY